MTVAYAKHKNSLRAWLLGKEYYKAVEALEFASKYHIGFRKDGSPEFEHQIAICCYVRTLANLRNQQAALISAILHDVSEDYDVSFTELENKFDVEIAKTVFLLTKKFRGEKKEAKVYYHDISQHPIASIVKGADRIHNHQTISAFTREKQLEYINETENFVLPMLKEARNHFPDQELAYENIKHALKGQIEFIKLIIGNP